MHARRAVHLGAVHRKGWHQGLTACRAEPCIHAALSSEPAEELHSAAHGAVQLLVHVLGVHTAIVVQLQHAIRGMRADASSPRGERAPLVSPLLPAGSVGCSSAPAAPSADQVSLKLPSGVSQSRQRCICTNAPAEDTTGNDSCPQSSGRALDGACTKAGILQRHCSQLTRP